MTADVGDEHGAGGGERQQLCEVIPTADGRWKSGFSTATGEAFVYCGSLLVTALAWSVDGSTVTRQRR